MLRALAVATTLIRSVVKRRKIRQIERGMRTSRRWYDRLREGPPGHQVVGDMITAAALVIVRLSSMVRLESVGGQVDQ